MAVKYTSIQVTPKMRRRLAQYKAPGMSYEEVLAVLTDAIPPDAFRAAWRRTGHALRDSLAGAVGRTPAAAAEEARRIEAQRVARLSPGQRMEEAFRLFMMSRGRR